MFCKHCGNQMPDDAVFCAKCGTSVSESARKAVNANMPPAPSPTAQWPSQPARPMPPAQASPARPAVQPNMPNTAGGYGQTATPPQGVPAYAAQSPAVAASAAQTSPLRFVEGGLAVVLVIMLLAVPFVDLSLLGSFSIPSLVAMWFRFLEAAGQFSGMMGQSSEANEAMVYVIALCALVVIAVVSGLITAFMTFVKPASKIIPFSWVMFICVGILVGVVYAFVNQSNGGAPSNPPASGSVLNIGPSIGAWITLAGCLVLGILDVVRATRK